MNEMVPRVTRMNFPIGVGLKYRHDVAWFDAGTPVVLIGGEAEDPFGLFEGYRGGELDEETCPWDEILGLWEDT